MVKHIITLPDGTKISAGQGAKNAITGVKLTETVNDAADLLLGSACSACLEVTILDPGGSLSVTNGSEIQLHEEASDGTLTKRGVFIAETPTKPTPNTLKLVCYDRIVKLDKDLTQWLKDLDGWPYTVAQFASMVCDACGLTLLDISSAPNSGYSVNKFTRSSVTGRALLQWCAEICCRFARATADGNIEMAWYRSTDKHLAPTGADYYISGGMSRADYQTAPIDLVQMRLADSNDGYLIPEATGDANAYIIKSNPLISGSTEEIKNILQNIYDGLGGITYTPCKAAFPSGRGIRAGDILSVTDRNGVTFDTVVMNMTRTGQLDTIESTGSQRRDDASAQENYRDTSADREHVAQEAVNRQSQTDIFNKLTNNGFSKGIYLLDGQLYINADYLATGVIRSADGTIEIDLANNKVTVKTDTGRLVLSATGLYGYGSDDMPTLILKPGTGDGTPALLNSFNSTAGLQIVSGKANSTLSLGQPGAYTEIRGKSIDFLGKTVSWKDNGDGTYTLIGQ